MTHTTTNRVSPLQTTFKVMLLVGAGFLALPSQGFAADNEPPEITFDGASDTLQDCLLTPGSTTDMDEGSVYCRVNGNTTECDLGKSGEDDQCSTTADRRAVRDKRRAESTGGAVVAQRRGKVGRTGIPILRKPVLRVSN